MIGKTLIAIIQFLVGGFFLLHAASDIQLGFGIVLISMALVNLFEANHDSKKK